MERYARALRDPAPDRMRVLEALRRARPMLLRAIARHPQGGLLVEAMRRDQPLWLMDRALAASAQPGFTFFARLAEADPEFAIGTGWIIPADTALLDALRSPPPAPEVEMTAEGAFAANLFRAAIALGRVAEPPPA